MARFDENSPSGAVGEKARPADRGNWFDVAVLLENEVTGTSARRMTEMYQMRSAPLRYHLLRPLGGPSARTGGLRQEAELLMEKSVERLEALQTAVTGIVTDQEPLTALLDVVTTTNSQEVVVVTGRHRLATMLHRDLASRVRSRVALPLVHLVER